MDTLIVMPTESEKKQDYGCSLFDSFLRWHFKQSSMPWQREPAGNCGATTPTPTPDPTAHRIDSLPQGEEGNTSTYFFAYFFAFGNLLLLYPHWPCWRLRVQTLQRSSPHLCQLFLTSIFIETEINIQQGSLYFDSFSDNGPFIWEQVKNLSGLRGVYVQ